MKCFNNDFHFDQTLFHEEVTKLISQLKAATEAAGDSGVDLGRSLSAAIINSLWTIAMGEKFEYSDARLDEILELMDRALRETSPQSAMALV